MYVINTLPLKLTFGITVASPQIENSMIAVTGAAGFIGSNLLAILESNGLGPLVAIDFLDDPKKRPNTKNRANIQWVSPPNALAFLDKFSDELRAIVHLGAETATTATDRAKVFAVNVDFSQDLWTWCARNHTPFIYASSASVYGDGSSGFVDDPSHSGMKSLKPLNIYGESKLAFDLFVTESVTSDHPSPPQWAGLRFFNVFGPNEFHKGSQASVASQMFPTAAAGKPYALFRSHREDVADGEQKRDFIFVDDCVSVILWLLASPDVSGIFNVGTGEARTFLNLASAVYAAVEQPLNLEWRDTPESLRNHYQYFTEADTSRLRSAGYKTPFTSLDEGVSLTIKKYLSQPDPYR